MSRQAALFSVVFFVVGLSFGLYGYEFVKKIDRATEVDDLKSELQLQKQMLAACKDGKSQLPQK